MSMNVKEVARVLNIGALAIEANAAEKRMKSARLQLDHAYADFREAEGLDYVTRDTESWDAMMAATKEEYEDLMRAKSEFRNVKRKLDRAILRKV